MFCRQVCGLYSLIAVSFLPTQILAADIYSKGSGSYKDGPSYASPALWSGLYFGAHAGYGWGDTEIKDGGTDIRDPNIPPHGAFSCAPALTGNYCGTPFELSPEGGLAGIQLGYNVQRGNLVFGVEGEFGWLNIDDGYVLDRPDTIVDKPDDQDFGSVEYGLYGTLTLRAGYAFDKALVYVKGGLAFADIETEAYDIDEGRPYERSRARSSGVQTGWALGAGLEYALSDRISVKAEYLYMDFGSDDSRSFDGDIYEQDHALHTAKLGLNFRLSRPDAEPLK